MKSLGEIQTLADIQKECYELAVSKGWGDPPPTFGEAIALLCAEACEALEEYRDHGLEDTTAYSPESIVAEAIGPPKPTGVGSEFADILIRLGHYCELFGIDLQAEYNRKMAYNTIRPYRHGGKRL